MCVEGLAVMLDSLNFTLSNEEIDLMTKYQLIIQTGRTLDTKILHHFNYQTLNKLSA